MGGGVLRLQGEIGLEQAKTVHHALVQALSQTSRLLIDLSQVTTVDLTLVQLLLAARRSAAEQGKALCLRAPGPSPIVQQTAAAAGFPMTAHAWLGLPIVEGKECRNEC
ncbi:MAG: hypothetical protein OZSIB_0447 [Candidatus Ozemobacter sibiricus]|uniref:STAS domain-containing protein n=1 Tax=Candidatus Ozemobacter sibiricus TaxID=2268124 RepID=A0A367ZLW1_9BACT|nr:MAG: hypothetical protein OZSIB_0447 [Candidatus Ozemobacter sibiricus]